MLARSPTSDAPEDALDAMVSAVELATSLRAAGWTVNLAVETGEGVEAFTFSARRPAPQPKDKENG